MIKGFAEKIVRTVSYILERVSPETFDRIVKSSVFYSALEQELYSAQKELQAGLASLEERYENQITGLDTQIRDIKESEQVFAERFGEAESERLRLQREYEGVQKRNIGLESALKEARTIIKGRDNLILHLKKTVHERREKRIEQYEKIARAIDRDATPVVLIGPDNKILYCGRTAKEQLSCDGTYVGESYTSILRVEEGSKDMIRDFFDNPRTQKARIPVVCGDKKTRDFRIIKDPIFYDKEHEVTFVFLSSRGFLEKLTDIFRNEDIEKQLETERFKREMREKTQRIIKEAQQGIKEIEAERKAKGTP